MKPITSKQKELLNTQLNAKETHKENYGNKIIERIPVENTPFTALYVQEQGWFLALGIHRVTELCETKEQAVDMLRIKMWDIVGALALILIDFKEKQKQGFPLTDKEVEELERGL